MAGRARQRLRTHGLGARGDENAVRRNRSEIVWIGLLLRRWEASNWTSWWYDPANLAANPIMNFIRAYESCSRYRHTVDGRH